MAAILSLPWCVKFEAMIVKYILEKLFLICVYREVLLPLPTHGPLATYIKLRDAHVPGMPGTFSLPPRVTHVP